jgi:hypothetical protein
MRHRAPTEVVARTVARAERKGPPDQKGVTSLAALAAEARRHLFVPDLCRRVLPRLPGRGLNHAAPRC